MIEKYKVKRFGKRTGRLRPICIVLGFCLLQCSLLHMLTGAGGGQESKSSSTFAMLTPKPEVSNYTSHWGRFDSA